MFASLSFVCLRFHSRLGRGFFCPSALPDLSLHPGSPLRRGSELAYLEWCSASHFHSREYSRQKQRPALLSDPPTSALGKWRSKAPSLSVGLFTMPHIRHGGAVEAHRLHPLMLSVEEAHKGPWWRGSLVRGPSAVVNLTQPRAEPPPRSANGALIAPTTSWVGRNVAGSRALGGWGRRGNEAQEALSICFPARGQMSPNESPIPS